MANDGDQARIVGQQHGPLSISTGGGGRLLGKDEEDFEENLGRKNACDLPDYVRTPSELRADR